MANATTDSTVILCFSAGVASGSLVGDHALIASVAGDNIIGVNDTNFISYDGTNSHTLAHGGFTATQRVVALLQTDISESKKRLGVWDDGAVTWASWAAFDLSFDVEAYLDVAVNSETMTYYVGAIYSSILADADLLTEISDLGINTGPVISSPSPADGSDIAFTTNADLSVVVTDFDGDASDVSFYDESDDSLIGTDSAVASGGTATVNWAGLTAGDLSWYVIADDGTDQTTSDTYTFTIRAGAIKTTGSPFGPPMAGPFNKIRS